MAPPGERHGMVKRELLVRLLDDAVPALLHSGRRFTYAEGYAHTATAVAALRVFGEFADRLRGQLTVVLVGGVDDGLPERLAAVRAELGLPAQVHVHLVSGPCDETLVAALRESGAFGAPILAYLDATGADPPRYDTVAALAAGRRADVLIAVDPAALATRTDTDRVFGSPDRPTGDDPPVTAQLVTRYREALCRTGLDRVAHVELVDDSGHPQLLFFATGSELHLDRFKGTLWALDEFAGVRYRDPRDGDQALLEISLDPHLGPLRRALLDRVRAAGTCAAGELRRHTRAETIYRAEDAFPALNGLVSAGKLNRQPERGRLTADTVLRTP